jgi:hypothetical protein
MICLAVCFPAGLGMSDERKKLIIHHPDNKLNKNSRRYRALYF